MQTLGEMWEAAYYRFRLRTEQREDHVRLTIYDPERDTPEIPVITESFADIEAARQAASLTAHRMAAGRDALNVEWIRVR